MSVLKYFIEFSFNGTLYRGAAKQSGRNSIRDIDTIQGVLETAFLSLRPPPKVTHVHLASRTDKGVHALHTVATVDIGTINDKWYSREYILQRINYFMKCTKNSIRLLECLPVSRDLHVRKIISNRTYLYRFMIAKEFGEHRVPMIEHQHTCIIRAECFDIQRLDQATQLFMGRKNFMTFAAQKKTVEPIQFERSLDVLRLEKASPLCSFDPYSNNFNYWHIICTARSFLYNQVRRIAGTLFAVATGKITERDINIMLTVPSHSSWDTRVMPALPHGLYLAKTQYDEDLLNSYVMEDKVGGTYSETKCNMPLASSLNNQ